VPARAANARKGKWLMVPGEEVFSTVKSALGKANIIAEDLGEPTKEALALRDRLGFPGMRVLQFAFGEDDYHRPHRFPRHCVAYTGTHDNDTILGWYAKVRQFGNGELTRTRDYLGRNPNHWDFIRLAMTSVANTVILPVQDLLGLDSEHRMNIPGTCDGNWTWRMKKQLSKPVVERLRQLTEATGRTKPRIHIQG
jgi:4-alpha-glucanotransferase